MPKEGSFPREQNPNWQGGRNISGHGYVRINVGRDHPMAGSGPYVYEHRLVMAEKLGRWLSADEIVHHIDGDTQNNKIENLKLRSRAEHMRTHYAGKPRPFAKSQPRAGGKFAASTERKTAVRKRRGKKPLPVAERLWPKIDRSAGEDACHPWTGIRYQGGYGRFFMPGGRKGSDNRVYAHRVVYELVYGSFDCSLIVMHTCDNPPCCNPLHLRLGTRVDNNRDRSNKGRGRENRQYGEANAFVKISDADVARIHSLRAEGWTQQRIAKEVGIKQPHVSRILRGQARAHGSS